MQKQIKAAPTIIYPESDGKPMAETDRHRKLMMDFIFMLENHFEDVNDVIQELMYLKRATSTNLCPRTCSLSSVS